MMDTAMSMMPQPIDSHGKNVDLPPLANYRNLQDYVPAYGDFVVWSGWFTTWFGVVANYEQNTGDVHIIYAGLPFLLFTSTDEEQRRDTRRIQLSALRMSNKGKYAILQHDFTKNASVWYI